MAKIPTKYFINEPWGVTEIGFDPNHGKSSESIFSLSNEYLGIRGFFEESYSGDKLIGTYFNGVYEVPPKVEKGGYLGISKKNHFMVNALNFLYTKIYINDQEIDINKISFTNFYRHLDFKTGELVRRYTVNNVDIEFIRLLDMQNYQNAYQVIKVKAHNDVKVLINIGFDYTTKHFNHYKFWKSNIVTKTNNSLCTIGTTKKTKMQIISRYDLIVSPQAVTISNINEQDIYTHTISQNLKDNEELIIEKRIQNYVSNSLLSIDNLDKSYHDAYISNQKYFAKLWKEYDIQIVGDEETEQGMRFSLFELFQTYLGINANNNIGAKGLTGEAYSGHAFWDTETYCLPFYLFNNPKAAKNLLLWRYNKLDNARSRAKELDCIGACFPIATLNGDEACNLWQHASLQLQPTTAVCHGIYNYVKNTNDENFLFDFGLEILLECSRFLYSRGDWNNDHTAFSFYGVMGPDEFQMMVNDNTYTNYMGKRSMAYFIESFDKLKEKDISKYQKFINKFNVTDDEIRNFTNAIKKMRILYNPITHLYEQHKGYYDLPHIDIHQIPQTDFPLYSHWTYDRIYRNDMIKQPDVLMMMFLYNSSFSFEDKLANYEFYEPRTIHESSLSPSIHSIIALELNKYDEGVSFFNFATRMDLDDYNRNTCEGIHMTSIAAAWVNIVYGFGGFRCDGDIVSLSPYIPNKWESYQFNLTYLNAHLNIAINKKEVVITTSATVTIKIYNNIYQIKDKLVLEYPNA